VCHLLVGSHLDLNSVNAVEGEAGTPCSIDIVSLGVDFDERNAPTRKPAL